MFESLKTHLWIFSVLLTGVSIADENVVGGFFADQDEAEQPAQLDSVESVDTPNAFKQHAATDLRLVLASGKTIDVGEIFREQGEAFERSLSTQMQSRKSTLIRANHLDSGRPLLLASRRGKVLHGPFASFADDGAPIAYVTYQRGERDATLFTWDEAHHPLVFAQYESGELHGLRCLFRTCCESCSNVHVWAVQQWDRGELQMAHLVLPDGKSISLSYWDDDRALSYRRSPEIESAVTQLNAFERRFERGEEKLKQLVAQYYSQEKQAAANRSKLVAAQQRYRFLMAAQSGSRPSFASFPSGGSFG